MKRDEAIEFMRKNPDSKVRNEYFSPDEWLAMHSDGYVYSEDGVNWGADISDWFKTCLTLKGFEDNWEIVKD